MTICFLIALAFQLLLLCKLATTIMQIECFCNSAVCAGHLAEHHEQARQRDTIIVFGMRCLFHSRNKYHAKGTFILTKEAPRNPKL